ncbi:MAG TPA: dTMP kinase [Candidatus Limnocylindrales bacterium]|jgi:dTMP kinase|nr:dTMP kinase [Candidatus Limnocylindrales bacterium]
MTDDSARRGRFVTLEGPDGAGKSSQAVRLAEALRARGLPVVEAREPGGTRIGEAIRSLLLDPESGVRHDSLTDALLFVAARAQLVTEVIRPALEADRLVVCDRFADSTLAYQGYAAGLDVEWLRTLNMHATGGLVPDLTVLLDLPAEIGLARRARGPGGERTRFERSTEHDAAFHARVRGGYQRLAQEEPSRWRIVDAAREPDRVAADVLSAVEALLARAGEPSSGEPIGASVRSNG